MNLLQAGTLPEAVLYTPRPQGHLQFKNRVPLPLYQYPTDAARDTGTQNREESKEDREVEAMQ